MSMKKRQLIIVTAFSISFILMIALSLFSMQRFATFLNYSNEVDHANAFIICIEKAEVSLRDIDRTERGYMITRDTMYVRFLNNSIDSLNSTIDEISAKAKNNTEQHNNIALLKASIGVRIAAARSNISYINANQTSNPSKFYYDSRQMMLDCSRRLRAMLTSEHKGLNEKYEAQVVYEKLTTDTLEYLLLIFCTITLILFTLMIKELRSRIKYQEELQTKVIDLKRSHSELEEIAYAASHDLQEPLRKIQIFSNKLLYKKSEMMDDDSINTVERISNSAKSMQSLINDLVSLTNLTKIDEQKTSCDLNQIVKYIIVDLEDVVNSKAATITIAQMPVIIAYRQQLKILFAALLDNALKFTVENRLPEIYLSFSIGYGSEIADVSPNLAKVKFLKIVCEDNGIGFDNIYITKIFRIFQRLHNQQSEYEGKGIGLAISQRIMANHEGYIIAEGTPQKGARFILFFPESILA